MGYDPRSEFGIPGTFDPTEFWVANEVTLHQGGLDSLDPAGDQPVPGALTGIIGFDPEDYEPSIEHRQDVERHLPQWGPPFVKFIDERLTHLEKEVQKAILKWSFETRTDYFVKTANTTSSGVLDISSNELEVYAPPPGFTMALHRLVILSDGYNAGTPFTGANAYWELRVGNEAISFGSMVSTVGSLPVEKTWGTRDAPRIRDGEVATLYMSGGPASKSITVKGQGSLDRTIEG